MSISLTGVGAAPAYLRRLRIGAPDTEPIAPFRGEINQSRRGILVWLALFAYTIFILTTDPHLGLGGQFALGGVTAVLLVAMMRTLRQPFRLRTGLVVCVATGAEVLGSIIWGVYRYRLHNLPAFVPPGHGLVYVSGLALAAATARRSDLLVRAAATGLVVWAVAGLIVPPRLDLAGAIGSACLLFVLWRSRNPVYAGVFFCVAIVELYGTARGVWAWKAHIPYLGLADGNPPSGAASGYVFFDVAAIALAPRVLRLWAARSAAVQWARRTLTWRTTGWTAPPTSRCRSTTPIAPRPSTQPSSAGPSSTGTAPRPTTGSPPPARAIPESTAASSSALPAP